MDILFMIGNGFDLNVGLNTRFSDFINHYLKIQNTDSRIIRFKEDINKNLDKWADAEVMLGQYTANYKAGDEDDFIYCLKDFRENLSRFLRTEEKRIDYNLYIDDIISVFTQSISNFHMYFPPARRNSIIAAKKSFQHEKWTYNFITYNYTGVLSKCIKVIRGSKQPVGVHSYSTSTFHDDIGQVIHIHGTVNKSMILGVDNEDQIQNEEFSSNRKFTKRFLKPSVNQGLKTLYESNASDLINKSRIICIFGMSLGETDLTWWKQVSFWLQKDKGRQLLIFVRDDDWNELNPEDSFAQEEAVWERFFRLTGIPEDLHELLGERIHVAVNADIFKIDLTERISISNS